MHDLPLLVISPHLDDAMLSLRRSLAASYGSIVATVFTAAPRDPSVLAEWDARAGFRTSVEAMAARVEEDKAALQLLGAAQLGLKLLDRQYGREPMRGVVEAVTGVVVANAEKHRVCGPIGIGHSDHRAVAKAFLAALTASGASQAWLYEEVPYRVEVRPGVIRRRLRRARRLGWCVEQDSFAPGDEAVSGEALACYASQLALLSHRQIGASERIWRLTRPS